MTRAFVKAVTDAINEGVTPDLWEHFYFKADGSYPLARRDAYLYARRSANGPGWAEFVRASDREHIRRAFAEPVAVQVARTIYLDITTPAGHRP